MELKNAVAVVTGANRGLGRHLAAQLVERGAKVYAAARRPETVDVPGVIPLRLDVTDEASIREAARMASDATLLINNAGISTGATLVGGGLDEVRREMETNFFGPLAATRAFAPVIEGNGGGAVLNVLSALSWFHPAGLGSYAASKAAAWALSDATREELAPRGITVSALHVGYMDTDMAAGVPADQKVAAADVAAQALDGHRDRPARDPRRRDQPVRQAEPVRRAERGLTLPLRLGAEPSEPAVQRRKYLVPGQAWNERRPRPPGGGKRTPGRSAPSSTASSPSSRPAKPWSTPRRDAPRPARSSSRRCEHQPPPHHARPRAARGSRPTTPTLHTPRNRS